MIFFLQAALTCPHKKYWTELHIKIYIIFEVTTNISHWSQSWILNILGDGELKFPGSTEGVLLWQDWIGFNNGETYYHTTTLKQHGTCQIHSLVMEHVRYPHWSWNMSDTLTGHGTCQIPSLVMEHVRYPHWSWNMSDTLTGHGTCQIPSLVMEHVRYPHWS